MTDSVIDINIVEVKTPDMDATLVAENVHLNWNAVSLSAVQ